MAANLNRPSYSYNTYSITLIVVIVGKQHSANSFISLLLFFFPRYKNALRNICAYFFPSGSFSIVLNHIFLNLKPADIQRKFGQLHYENTLVYTNIVSKSLSSTTTTTKNWLQFFFSFLIRRIVVTRAYYGVWTFDTNKNKKKKMVCCQWKERKEKTSTDTLKNNSTL